MMKSKAWRSIAFGFLGLLVLNIMYAVKSLSGIDLDKKRHHGDLFPLGAWIYERFRPHPPPLNFAGLYSSVDNEGNIGKVSGMISDGWSDNSGWGDVEVAYKKIILSDSPDSFAQGIEVSHVGANAACQFAQAVPVTSGCTYRASVVLRSFSGSKVQLLLRQARSPYRIICISEAKLNSLWSEVAAIGTPKESDLEEGTVEFMLITHDVGSFEIRKAALSKVMANTR